VSKELASIVSLAFGSFALVRSELLPLGLLTSSSQIEFANGGSRLMFVKGRKRTPLTRDEAL